MRNPLNTAVAQMGHERKSATTSELLPAFKDGRPIWSGWDTSKAITDGFKASAWVYACIYRIMKAAASVPWVAERKNADGKWESRPDDPLTHLVENPNPFMSRQDVIERLTTHLYLGGNGLFSKIKVRGTTVELWPLDASGIKPVPSRQKFISGYRFDRDGVVKTFMPEDVIHWMFTDPATPYWGMSPLQAASRIVDTDVEAVKWNKVALQNRAITDGVFSFDRPLTKEQWEEARENVREQYQDPDSRRGPWVLGSGAKWNQMSLSPVEMDWLESLKHGALTICAVFNVPPALVSISKDGAFSSEDVAGARKILWEDTVIPFLDDVKEGFNRSLVPEFGDRQSLRLAYDISNVVALRQDFQRKVEAMAQLVGRGVPLNVAMERLEMGIEPVSGGDVGFIPATMVPMELAGGEGLTVE